MQVCSRCAGLALLLAALLGMVTVAHGQDEPLPLSDYVELIESAQAALTRAAPDQAQAVLAEQVQRLAAVQTVQLPSGATVTVEPLLGQVAETGAAAEETASLTLDVALARLHTVQTQLDAAAGDEVAARLATLEAILARPEFNTPVSLLERIALWLRDLLRRWFPNLNLGGSGEIDPRVIETILWLLAGIGLIAIVVLLAGWVRRLARSLLDEAEAERQAFFADLPRTAAEARQQAHSAAQSGAYRDAVRRLYLAALLQLNEARLLPFDPSLTNREVLARLRQDSPVRAYLEPVVATFDSVWYGMHEPDQATFERYAAAIDALEQAARQATASTGQAL